jgi:CubicO group peptidase (beta-lactamase class C family)
MEVSTLKVIFSILVLTAFFNVNVVLNTTPRTRAADERQNYCRQPEAQRTSTPDLQGLKDDIAKTVACLKNSGLAVSVIRNGQKILSEGFGETRSHKGTNVTAKTLFSIASLTKAFTAALLLDVMARNGSVKLTSTVRDVVGGGFSFNDSQRTQYATIEDLLAHRLRVPENSEFRFNPQIDRHELLKRVRFFESKSEFRVKGSYSSTNYIMLAAITELLGNTKWEQLIAQTLFSPLEMTSSSFAAAVDFNDDNVAAPFSTFEGEVGDIDPAFTKQWNSLCGSGCIFSTADDMANWMNFHLSNGKNIHGKQVLPETLVRDLHVSRTLLPSADLSLESIPQFPVTQTGDLYALGWRVGHYRGYQILSHTGSTPGYTAMITLVPSENLGVFVVLNGDDENTYYRTPLQNYIIDTILGFEPWLNTSTICTFPQPWHTAKTSQLPVYDVGRQPPRDLTEYIGVYSNEGYGDLSVELNTTLSSLTVRFGFGFWQLLPQQTKDVFYAKGLDVTSFYDVDFVVFTASPNSDKIVSLIVKGFNRSLPPIFLRVSEPVIPVG